MSRIHHKRLTCPGCGAPHEAALYLSLNAHAMPHLIADILGGRFAVQVCAACERVWQPDHHMLFAWPQRRLWVVMMPSVEQHRVESLEAAVLDVLWRAFDAAPAVVEERLADNDAYIVFGHPALAERIQVAVGDLSHGGVESLKGPLRDRWQVAADASLRLVGLNDAAARFAVFGATVAGFTPEPQRFETLARAEFDAALTPEALAAARERWPELFDRPWCDVTRYSSHPAGRAGRRRGA